MAKSGRNNRKRNRRKPKVLQYNAIIEKRMAIQFYLIVIAFLFLLIHVISLNITDGERYTIKILNKQSITNRDVDYKRGDIVDANGTVLATSVRAYNVILDPDAIYAIESDEEQLLTIEEIKKTLKEVFDIETSEIEKGLLRDESKYYNLKSNVSYSLAREFDDRVADKENYPYLQGVWLEDTYIRNYPYGTMASSLIGFINSDGEGVAGIELSYNNILKGINGRIYSHFIDTSVETIVKEAENGATVVTTIDQTLQSIVEEKVLEFNEEYTDNYTDGAGSVNTAVIITDPNTGAILASTSYPNYDLNNPGDLSVLYEPEEILEMELVDQSKALNELRSNYVTSTAYEAGSTIKPFTVAAAIECGAIDGTETYYCGGSLNVADYTIRCALRTGHGVLNVEQSLAYSCNVAMMLMAEEIGVNAFTAYQKNFGFGPVTGSDLPNEASTTSLIYTEKTMGETDLATNSFGQNFNVTMLQMVAGTGALINGGNYYKPYVVQQVQDSSGRIVSNTEPTLVRKIISESTVDVIQDGMRACVEYGSGRQAGVSGYDVGGKTGTAEKLPRGNGKYLISFIGAAPMDDPEILIYVIIDEPNTYDQGSGGFASILAGDILKEALPYMGISKKEE